MGPRCIHLVAAGAALSHCAMWCAAGALMAGAAPLADTPGAAPGLVPQEQVVVTVPIFISSIIATAIFTWTVRGVVSSRDAKVSHLERQVSRLLKDRGLEDEPEERGQT